MFKRQIQISMVKGSKKQDPTEENASSFDQEMVLDTVSRIVTGTGFTILQVVVGYMALDTVRKIAVNRLSK